MSVFAKKRQLFKPVSIARTNWIWLTGAVWLAICGSVLAFGLGRDFERPKALCLSLAAAMLMPRAHMIWPTWPQQVRVAVRIWVLVLAAAVLLALDPARALIGSYERSQGAFLLVCCTILALARVPVAILIAPVTVAVCVSGAWAIAQFFGLEAAVFAAVGLLEPGLSGTGWQRAFGWRAFAGFGNPMALGGWLVIAWLFLFFARVRANPTDPSAMSLRMLDGALFFGACGLLLCGTRAAWIALAVVGILALRQKKWVRMIAAATLVAAGVGLMSFRADSLHARLDLASATVSPVKTILVDGLGMSDPHPAARLWLGAGPDLQVVMLEQGLPKRAPGEMPDRAHQMLLDGYLSIGLLGVMSWLWLMSTVWRARMGSNSGVVYALTAALIAWQFGFALSAEKVLFALLLGSICAPILDFKTVENTTLERKNGSWMNIFAALFAVFSMLSYLPRSLLALDTFAPWRRPERAIAHFERARLAIMANQGELATRELAQALALDPWRADLARAKTNLALELRHNAP